jgi:adenosylcobinamide-GDP ribazoletransferase
MKAFRIALSFLTRYPLPWEEEAEPRDFGRSTAYYPLVGFMLGLDLWLLRWFLLLDKNGLHYPLWSVGLLAFWIFSCDSLHLDGLADTADALGSRLEGTDFRRVLKDSRIGSFGALALGLALLARCVWLIYLPMQNLWFLPLPLIFSRLLSSLACQLRPYAGEKRSLGAAFIDHSMPEDLSLAISFAFACSLLLAGLAIALEQAALREAAIALIICLGGLAAGRLILNLPISRQGGISGDLIGWAQVITEILICYGLSIFLLP